MVARIIGLALLLSACTTHYVWTGRTAREWASVDWHCQLAAEQIMFVTTTVPVYNEYLMVAVPVGITTFPVNGFAEDIYIKCMEGEGFTLKEKK